MQNINPFTDEISHYAVVSQHERVQTSFLKPRDACHSEHVHLKAVVLVSARDDVIWLYYTLLYYIPYKRFIEDTSSPELSSYICSAEVPLSKNPGQYRTCCSLEEVSP